VRRPFGVNAIVGLLFVSAALGLGAGGAVFILRLVGNTTLLELFPDAQPMVLGEFALLALEGVADLVAAIGLLLMRRWAWVLTMLLVGYRMATNLWLHFSSGGGDELELVLDVVIVFYLNQRDVQRAFGYGSARRPRQAASIYRHVR
jgi:hypothetical protein